MSQDGLTPSVEAVRAVLASSGSPGDLMVMVRPRAGDFCYSHSEERIMAAQIRQAAEAGADGVVVGALRPDNGRICRDTMHRLIHRAHEHGLSVTFHRAFDATPDTDEALETLIGLGITRILTSGCPWGSGGTALDGISRLHRTITQAAGRLEVVVGGGVTVSTLPQLLAALPLDAGPVSVHAYSGAQTGGVTTLSAVRSLVDAAQDVRK
jgi:copper homeostasis protein